MILTEDQMREMLEECNEHQKQLYRDAPTKAEKLRKKKDRNRLATYLMPTYPLATMRPDTFTDIINTYHPSQRIASYDVHFVFVERNDMQMINYGEE